MFTLSAVFTASINGDSDEIVSFEVVVDSSVLLLQAAKNEVKITIANSFFIIFFLGLINCRKINSYCPLTTAH
jgi:hypothetical protein